MLRIVMDGAGDMPSDWGEKYGINVIPINIQFKEQTYLQNIDLSDEEFYRIAKESGIIPKTSQPSPQQFIDFYRKIAETGDTILSIHVTSKLSGTFASAEIATKELEGEFNIFPIDSESGSVAMGYMCKEARLMDRGGYSIDDILKRMDYIINNNSLIVTLDTLEFAKMSGRVKTLQAALASVLNVKPIVVLRDGVLDMAEKVRTRRRSLDFIVNKMHERVKDVSVNAAVVHAQDIEAGKTLLEKVRSTLNCKELVMTDLGIAVAANLGPGTVGIIAYPVEEGK